ncbi:DUF2797 domain-containing protein [Arthrobacter psychrochitiniphilus]|uniref:DUF2797 domain-containing protein n=1 Tax=Arthrobacter psychrochitiniphilus TaxID=291045 RepID=UPI0018268243|nr:DUF2797 domain-containing protein [Arthrobacter psychrochitiniphilus]NYG18769.1 hypothetical protein [Arthrobacter psychrochitiniphilus]
MSEQAPPLLVKLVQHQSAALVRGVSWSAEGPSLSLTTDDGDAQLPLVPGQWLKFEVLRGDGVPARHCLGFALVNVSGQPHHVPCPTGQPAERGFQCGACFGKDEMRYMHDFHRSGIAPPGLKTYLAQRHWLYIATFADGTTKVGTASEPSKWRRLAEQGALVARYVALARDGSVVRHLEDSVSTNLPPTQFVRGAAKFAALLHPRPPLHLEQTNKAMASVVRDYVGGLALEGFHTVDEQWERSVFSDAVAGPSRRAAYPQPLDSGAHGIRLDSMLGLTALVGVDDVDGEFLLDLGALKGRKIRFGEYKSTLPALQESLF